MKASTLTILCILLLVITSCKKTKSSQTNNVINSLVQSYTKGTISTSDEVIIRFNQDVPSARQGDVLTENVLNFSPKVEGTAYWFDARTLAFKAKNWFQPNTKYDCTLKIEQLFPSQNKGNANINFNFHTKKQDYSIGLESLIAQDETYRLEGTILLANAAKNEAVEKMVSINNNTLNAKLKWQHASLTKHTFYVDSIERQINTQTLIILHKGQSVGVDNSDELSIEIPGLNNFKVLDIRIQQEPAQYLNIQFSDALNENQDITGLIQLEGIANLKMQREKNSIKLYTPQRISGTKKLIISGDLQNSLSYSLGETFEKTVSFESLKPDVRFPQSGVIIPSSNKGCIVPFQAVNLSAVDVYIIKIFEKNIPYFLQSNQISGDDDLTHFGRLILKKKIDLTSDKLFDAGTWSNFSLDLKQLIETEPGAIYRVEFRFEKAYSLYPCSGDNSEEDNALSADEEDSEDLNAIWDRGGYWPRYTYNEDYEWRERNNPCHVSYYQNKWTYRNVIASNIGLIAKTNGQNGYRVIATDIITANPLSGINISFYNHQNLLLSQTQTNSDGIADLQLEGLPWLIVAERNGEKTYLRVDDGSSLSYSSFDVSGNIQKNGLNAFFYGERGVWRPGDTIHLAFVVNDVSNPLPENQPATLYFYNPESKLTKKIVNTNPIGKFYKFNLLTSATAPTGNWLARVSIGGAQFTKTIKVETIKPNRLKIDLDFGSEVLEGSAPLLGKLNVNWLHGTPGKNLKVKTDVIFRPLATSFSKYTGFIFSDPSKEFDMREETIFEGSTNASGEAKFSFNKSLTRYAPSMLKAIFTIKAFEPGGEFSIVQKTKQYSPFKTYIGIRMPEKPKNSWHYNSGNDYTIQVASLTKDGKPVDVEKLLVKVYKLEWEWWWHSNNSNLAYYIQRNYNKSVFTKTISTKNGEGSFKLNIDKKSWGRYLIRVENPDGHSTGVISYFDWPWRKSNEGTAGATRLTFNTDKENYTVGDDIKVHVPAENGARAWVSIESGTTILQNFWIDIKENGGDFTLKASSEMAPNAYINITLIQPYQKTLNENPIRMYGVIPLFVNDPNTLLQPYITLPESVEPEQEFSVQVGEKTGKAMTYTIAIVDEGLLDITNFKTPDIHSAFFQRQALLVKMWDMFDYVSGAFGGKIEKVFGIGGDEALNNKDKKDDSRFKPVVLYSGPHTLKKGEKATHNFKMPKYIGSVKAMVIAGAENKYGSGDKVMPVKKPVMVLATLPRVLAPGEKVGLPVSVFIMDENIKKANVSLQLNSMFKTNKTSKDIEINELGEYSVSFDLDVLYKIGKGKVKVIVKTAKGTADYDINIDVRNPNLPQKSSYNIVLNQNESRTIDWSLAGIEGTNSAIVEISSMPPLNLASRLDYLIKYPYGCIEQTTSSVFPQLFIKALIAPSKEQLDGMRYNIETAIDKLLNFQQSNGAFSYWPGNSYISSWGSSYATHFLLEAENMGYALPFGMKDKALEYLNSMSTRWNSSNDNFYYDLDHAYRLYVLALAGKPDMSGMNRLRQKSKLNQQTKWRLASAYALAGKNDVAESLIDMSKLEVAEYEDFSNTYGSAFRDYAMLLETLTQLGKKEEAARLVKKFPEALSNKDQWLSTQTTAWMLLSLSKAKQLIVSSDEDLSFDYKITSGNNESVKSEEIIKTINWVNDVDTSITITNNMSGVLFVTVNTQGTPLKDTKPIEAKNMALNVTFTDLDGSIIDPTSIPQGTDFKAIYTLKYTGIGRHRSINNIALKQIFPSGWEIINSRLYGDGYRTTGQNADYEDIRDDRIFMFFDLKHSSESRFEVLLNAAYTGEYILPATIAEAMYSNAYYARTKSKTVKVVKQ